MEKIPLREVFANIEALINSGQIKAAAQLLEKVKPVPNTRLETLVLARIYRRLGNPEQTLRLLAPVVRPKVSLIKPANEEEKLEYAIGLQRVGSLLEASEIVAKLDPEKTPEVLLVQAVVLFSSWNYLDAIPKLQSFLEKIPADSYSARLGKLNLCAALVHEARTESKALLEDLIRETHEHGEHLLMGNAFEISAQSAVLSSSYDEAEALLQKAEEVLSGVKVLDFLWLVKWKNILVALREKTLAPLETIRVEALRKKHWETLREVDFFKLQIEFREDTFLKLYYGTKSPHYRARIKHLLPAATLFPDVSIGEEGSVQVASAHDLDLFSMSGDLAPGTTSQALLVHFLSDSYRGFRAGELHSILFPGDHYNPDTSLNRVYQAVSRFRKTLEKCMPFVEVEIDDYIYRLRIQGPTRVRLPRVLPEPDPLHIRLFVFARDFGERVFTSEDVQAGLKISKANANKLINQWIEASLARVHLEQRPRLYKIV